MPFDHEEGQLVLVIKRDLNKLMKNEDYMLVAGEVLHDYYIKNNLQSEARKILLKMETKQDENDAFYQEINTLSIKDRIIKDDLSKDEFEQLKKIFTKLNSIKNIWIAKKTLLSYPNERLCIIVYKLGNQLDEERLFKLIEKDWPLKSMYFLLNHNNRKIAKAIIKAGRKVV